MQNCEDDLILIYTIKGRLHLKITINVHYYQKLHHKSSKGILKSISSKFHAIGINISHVINFFLISDIWAHSAPLWPNS